MPLSHEHSPLINLLVSGAESIGCALTQFQVDQFLIYLSELKEWNNRINLTAITQDEDVIEKHFIDSLAGLMAIEKRDSQTLLDIGTGAGFPGLPLKIAFPALRVTLLESSQKKAAFLYHLMGKLKITETPVLNQRVETLAGATARYDLIVARAFARKEVVLEKALPLLSDTGRLILYQGRPGPVPSVVARFSMESLIQYRLPFSNTPRQLEVFTRI